MSVESKSHSNLDMTEMIKGFEAKNRKLGGQLCSKIGILRPLALVFPTPVAGEGEEAGVYKFLLTTRKRHKIIRVDSSKKGIRASEVQDFINEDLGKKIPNPFSDYNDVWGLSFKLSVKISEKGTTDLRGTDILFGVGSYYSNCRLAEADSLTVEKILTANIKRVEDTRATSQRVSKILSGANN